MKLLRDFFNAIKELFTDKEVVKPRKKMKVSIIIGHDSYKSGAVNYKNESEYSFNSRIADLVKKNLDGTDVICRIHHKMPHMGYKTQNERICGKVKDNGSDLAIELHFNAFKNAIVGCEAVFLREQTKGIDQDLALEIIKNLGIKLNISKRHSTGLLYILPKGRGGHLLKSLQDINVPAFIFEPCFGNFKTDESEAIFENENLYAKIISNSLQRIYLDVYQ